MTFAVFERSPILGLSAIALVMLMALVWRRPEVGVVAGIFAIYSNAAVVVAKYDAQSPTLSSLFPSPLLALWVVVLLPLTVMFALPLVKYILVRRERLIIDKFFLLMLCFLGAQIASSLFARDEVTVERQLGDFIGEGLLLYFVVVNVVRSAPTLKQVVRALLLAGALMGGLSLIQEYTHSWDNNYGGFAQLGGVFENGENGRVVSVRGRSAGPIGEENRYAQILLVLLPLGVVQIRRESSMLSRTLAALSVALILCGIMLTFSRGALLTVILLFITMLSCRYIRVREVAIPILVISLAMLLIGGDVVARAKSLQGVASVFGMNSVKADTSIRGRFAQQIAMLQVVVAHPLFGVAPGHYAEFYSTAYVNRFGLIGQRRQFRGHNLYLEIAAETGLVGLSCFLLLVIVLCRRLWRQAARLAQAEGTQANLPGACLLSIVAYLTSGITLHLAYQRFFWLLVALSAVSARLMQPEGLERGPESPA